MQGKEEIHTGCWSENLKEIHLLEYLGLHSRITNCMIFVAVKSEHVTFILQSVTKPIRVLILEK
jgi:hypothetical protein